jgi:hypothetical protein
MMSITSNFTAEVQESLRHHLMILMEADEPEAILGSLQRIAERKAHSVIRGHVTEHDAERWLRLAKALARVQEDLGY